jgi:hypothetical protein
MVRTGSNESRPARNTWNAGVVEILMASPKNELLSGASATAKQQENASMYEKSNSGHHGEC